MADKIWSYFSEQTKDRLRVVADGRHVAMAEAAALLVMEALEPRPEGGSTTAGAPSPPSLDDPASPFLGHLPPDQGRRRGARAMPLRRGRVPGRPPRAEVLPRSRGRPRLRAQGVPGGPPPAPTPDTVPGAPAPGRAHAVAAARADVARHRGAPPGDAGRNPGGLT